MLPPSEEEIEELRKIYKEVNGEELSLQEATDGYPLGHALP